MSLTVLFDQANKKTLKEVCDVLDVVTSGGKVKRWVVIGRDITGFDMKRFGDAWEFLTWLRDGKRMDIPGLVKATSSYLGERLLNALKAMAFIIIASEPFNVF